ncbi:LysE family translocator [Tahibacter amnicola]|uniref:LysE family translocator n=1 Tax=Tahibacter amnicola TaxID=2976241 RepID=A0ABY6BH58_9GAMM|nr:LysE family translocator [Tahibacter amnicola]UXI69099.1 LysE family translocator [Tahibacter amnicola]
MESAAMHWDVVAAFTATLLVMCLIPGPAVLLVVGHAVKSGWRDSFYASLGVQAGNGIYYLLCIAGLGALLATSETVFHIIKWIGALYLIYLGLRTIALAKKNAMPSETRTVPLLARPFLQGMLGQLANPKSVLFFGALLPQFLDPGYPLLPQYALYGVLCFVVEVPILAVYGWLAARGSTLSASPRVAVWRERVSGACLVSVGASIAAVRRTVQAAS